MHSAGKNAVTVILCIFCVQLTIGRYVDSSDERWEPHNPDIDRDEYIKYGGLTAKEHKFVEEMTRKTNKIIANVYGNLVDDNETYIPDTSDVMITPDQIQEIYDGLEAKRRKRKVLNFKKSKEFRKKKWKLPIPYKINAGFTSLAKRMINRAIKQWEEWTCIRFKHVPVNEPTKENHLLFTPYRDECSSFVGVHDTGRCNTDCKGCRCPQIIKLGRGCATYIHTPLHEIGHAIGFHHEHVRPDRDQHVIVKWHRIKAGLGLAFAFRYGTVTLGVPYEFSSMMHYMPRDWSNNDRRVLIAKDPLFQKAMGQEVGLSFYDIKLANLAYCKASCPSLPCQRGGIPHPNKCDTCICPDGFGGLLCDKVAFSDGVCTAGDNKRNTILVNSTEESCIGLTVDDINTKCNWHFKAEINRTIEFYFTENFSVFCCYNRTCCRNWIEVKYKGDLTDPGPRFCCNNTPTKVLKSEKNEAMVTLRINEGRMKSAPGEKINFNLCYKLKRMRKG